MTSYSCLSKAHEDRLAARRVLDEMRQADCQDLDIQSFGKNGKLWHLICLCVVTVQSTYSLIDSYSIFHCLKDTWDLWYVLTPRRQSWEGREVKISARDVGRVCRKVRQKVQSQVRAAEVQRFKKGASVDSSSDDKATICCTFSLGGEKRINKNTNYRQGGISNKFCHLKG